MLYAKIAVGLPPEGPFDYIVPEQFCRDIRAGSRAWVDFARRRLVGYCLGLSRRSSVKGLKEISSLIDKTPLLSACQLRLAKELSRYYCCSRGEAIEAMLPPALRRGSRVELGAGAPALARPAVKPRVILLHDAYALRRQEAYCGYIKETLSAGRSALMLLPDAAAVAALKELFAARFQAAVFTLFRGERGELQEWLKIRRARNCIVIGTRSAIFAPLADLGLLIIEQEEDAVYKQEQSPHYHSRQLALLRAEIEGATVVLGSGSPSLESFFLAQKGRWEYLNFSRFDPCPEIRFMRGPPLNKKARSPFSFQLEEAIARGLAQKGKTLVFLNRKGFSLAAACVSCGKEISCPRCNTSLVYYFSAAELRCRWCAFRMPAPKVCPQCNAGYLRFRGAGTQKIESELARIFPQAKIARLDQGGGFGKEADIFVATSRVMKFPALRFDLVAVLGMDSAINRVDFRAAEKAFALLRGLIALARGRVVVQTSYPAQAAFSAAAKNDSRLFYENELKNRRLAGFPPFRHIVLVRLRGKNSERVKNAAEALFDLLGKADKASGVQLMSAGPGIPAKLRGNFQWQLVASCANPPKAGRAVKSCLKKLPHSGIIVALDVDPV